MRVSGSFCEYPIRSASIPADLTAASTILRPDGKGAAYGRISLLLCPGTLKEARQRPRSLCISSSVLILSPTSPSEVPGYCRCACDKSQMEDETMPHKSLLRMALM